MRPPTKGWFVPVTVSRNAPVHSRGDADGRLDEAGHRRAAEQGPEDPRGAVDEDNLLELRRRRDVVAELVRAEGVDGARAGPLGRLVEAQQHEDDEEDRREDVKDLPRDVAERGPERNRPLRPRPGPREAHAVESDAAVAVLALEDGVARRRARDGRRKGAAHRRREDDDVLLVRPPHVAEDDGDEHERRQDQGRPLRRAQRRARLGAAAADDAHAALVEEAEVR